MNSARPAGMRAFWIVWAGQLVSLLGSGMTQFALTIWAYKISGTATALALLGVFFMVPLLVLSPVVGVVVDRYDRKLMMMLSDLAAGVTTIVIFLLYGAGQLEIWHLYVSAVINGAFQGFQWPAFSAAITLMIPKSDYVRANSMMEIVGAGSNIVAPGMAGAIMGLGSAQGFDGLRFILLFDIVSFSAALGTLAWIHVPKPSPRDPHSEEGGRGFLSEAVYGFKYIVARPSLLGLQLLFLTGNFLSNMGQQTLMAPMLLARTGSNALILGAVETIGSVAVVLGGLVVGAWGGFKRRVNGVIWGWVVTFVFGSLLAGLGRSQPTWMLGLWGVGIFFGAAVQTLVNGSNQAIWMAKVPPEVQGRVFSSRRLIAWVATPLAALVAGPLADRVMEPAMMPGGALAHRFGWLVGTGPGAGMALILVALGVLGTLAMLAFYLVPAVRRAEDILPDHDAGTAPSESLTGAATEAPDAPAEPVESERMIGLERDVDH